MKRGRTDETLSTLADRPTNHPFSANPSGIITPTWFCSQVPCRMFSTLKERLLLYWEKGSLRGRPKDSWMNEILVIQNQFLLLHRPNRTLFGIVSHTMQAKRDILYNCNVRRESSLSRPVASLPLTELLLRGWMDNVECTIRTNRDKLTDWTKPPRR